MAQVTWVLESEVFAECHLPLRAALESGGFDVIDWDDEWWSDAGALS